MTCIKPKLPPPPPPQTMSGLGLQMIQTRIIEANVNKINIIGKNFQEQLFHLQQVVLNLKYFLQNPIYCETYLIDLEVL